VIIKLKDGLQVAIPRWMLDSADCASIRDELKPRVSIRALLVLRELIDGQSLSSAQQADSSRSSDHPPGGIDEQDPASHSTPSAKA
jgi:hypothetical protein